MKKRIAYIMLAICLLGLAGCKKGDSQTIDQVEIKENTTLLYADGTVQSVIVETFDKDYYKKDELKNYVDKSIQSYSKTAGNDAVKLDSLDVKDKSASAKFSYKDISAYATFNSIEAEILTKEQALQDERISSTVYSIEKEETVDLQTALEEKDYKILVIHLPGENIMTEGEIAYYTNGTLSGNSIIKTGSEGIAVVIYE